MYRNRVDEVYVEYKKHSNIFCVIVFLINDCCNIKFRTYMRIICIDTYILPFRCDERTPCTYNIILTPGNEPTQKIKPD